MAGTTTGTRGRAIGPGLCTSRADSRARVGACILRVCGAPAAVGGEAEVRSAVGAVAHHRPAAVGEGVRRGVVAGLHAAREVVADALEKELHRAAERGLE